MSSTIQGKCQGSFVLTLINCFIVYFLLGAVPCVAGPPEVKADLHPNSSLTYRFFGCCALQSESQTPQPECVQRSFKRGNGRDTERKPLVDGTGLADSAPPIEGYYNGTWISVIDCLMRSNIQKQLEQGRLRLPDSGVYEDIDEEPTDDNNCCALCDGIYSFDNLDNLPLDLEQQLLKDTHRDIELYKRKKGVVGGQARIYLKKDFVIKKAVNRKESKALLREANALAALNEGASEESHIIKLLWCCLDSTGQYVLLFFNKYDDDIFDFVEEEKNENEMGVLAWQLASALQEQENKSIINGDVKDMNVFFHRSTNANAQYVLADYGKATSPECDKCWRNASKPKDFDYNVAPEVRQGRPHLKSDYWSFAVLLIECMVTGNESYFKYAFEMLSSCNPFYKLVKEDKNFNWLQKICIYEMVCPNALCWIVENVPETDNLLFNNKNVKNPFFKNPFFKKNKKEIARWLKSNPEERSSSSYPANPFEQYAPCMSAKKAEGDIEMTADDLGRVSLSSPSRIVTH